MITIITSASVLQHRSSSIGHPAPRSHSTETADCSSCMEIGGRTSWRPHSIETSAGTWRMLIRRRSGIKRRSLAMEITSPLLAFRRPRSRVEELFALAIAIRCRSRHQSGSAVLTSAAVASLSTSSPCRLLFSILRNWRQAQCHTALSTITLPEPVDLPTSPVGAKEAKRQQERDGQLGATQADEAEDKKGEKYDGDVKDAYRRELKAGKREASR